MQIKHAGLFAHADQFIHLAEDIFLHFRVEGGPVPLRLEAHAAQHGTVEPLHPGDRPAELFGRLLEVLLLERAPAPVRHRASEAVDFDA